LRNTAKSRIIPRIIKIADEERWTTGSLYPVKRRKASAIIVYNRNGRKKMVKGL
jgi:hypothetical protein